MRSYRGRFGIWWSVFVLLTVSAPALAAVRAGGPCPGPVCISEIRIDQPGADTDEFFELANLTSAGIDLDDLTYVVLGDGAGGSGEIEVVVPLEGMSISTGGFFVAAESSFTLGSADLIRSLNFENSDNVTHLLVAGFSGVLGQDLDPDDDGTLDQAPWTQVLDRIALIEEPNPPAATEFHYGPPVIGPDGSSAPFHVWQCDQGWSFGPQDPVGGQDTPGAAALDCELTGMEPTAIRLRSLRASGQPGPHRAAVVFALLLLTAGLALLRRLG